MKAQAMSPRSLSDEGRSGKQATSVAPFLLKAKAVTGAVRLISYLVPCGAGQKRGRLILLVGLIWLSLLPEMARACGGFISPDGSNVETSGLTAALIFEPQTTGGRERLILKLDYRVSQGSVQNFGWVMPVPGQPEVAVAPDDWFARLEKATSPRPNYIEQLFGPGAPWRPANRGGAVASGGPNPAVTVVSQARVGAFDITVVAASEQAALSKWAADNAYTSPALDSAAVRDYLAKGWFFVLAKLATEQGRLDASSLPGQTQTLVLSFDSPEPVYPWRLAAYNPAGKLATNRLLPTKLYTLQPGHKLGPKNILAGQPLELRYAEAFEVAGSRDLLKDLPGDNSKAYFVSSYRGVVKASDLEAADLSLKTSDEGEEVGTGKLKSVGEWLLAGVATFFYGEIALLVTLGVLLTSDFIGYLVGLILLALIAAFVIPRPPRRIALVVLAAINFVLGAGILLSSLDYAPAAVLLSILPMVGLLVWAVWAAFFKKRLVKIN